MSRIEELSAIWGRRGLRALARRLPRRLAADYGASARYTPDQLDKAMERSAVPARLRPFGFAAFLDMETYGSLSAPLDRRESYEPAKAAFFRAAGASTSAYSFSPTHGDYTSIVQAPPDGF